MGLFGLHLLTNKQLNEKIETAKTEQRRLSNSLVSNLCHSSVILAARVGIREGRTRPRKKGTA